MSISSWSLFNESTGSRVNLTCSTGMVTDSDSIRRVLNSLKIHIKMRRWRASGSSLQDREEVNRATSLSDVNGRGVSTDAPDSCVDPQQSSMLPTDSPFWFWRSSAGQEQGQRQSISPGSGSDSACCSRTLERSKCQLRGRLSNHSLPCCYNGAALGTFRVISLSGLMLETAHQQRKDWIHCSWRRKC